MRVRVSVLAGLLLVNIFGWLIMPSMASAVGSGVYISELQTAGSGTGHSSDEFIELYNSAASDVLMSGWVVEYRSASSTNGSDCTKGWSKLASLPSLAIKSHGFFLLANKAYPIKADLQFSLGLANDAGTIRVKDGAGQIVDSLAWGDGTPCGAGKAPVIVAGQSLERLPGAEVPSSGNAYDTGDNANDFVLRTTPEQQSATSPTETPLLFDATKGRLELSEILAHPDLAAASKSQFVEFHNTGTGPVMLSEYLLKVGLASFYLPQKVVLPGAYLALDSESFSLALPGSGTISLLDKTDAVLDSATWTTGPTGASWAVIDGAWSWTAKPTPASANELVAPAAPDGDTSANQSQDYPVLELSELLPDPAAPATDAADEFIELHNPNAFPVNLKGYMLKVGAALSDSFVLPDVVVAADGYMAFTSAETPLTLTNSGSTVALFDPAGRQLGDNVAYAAAKTGQSWAKFATAWSWTTTPTPSEPNVNTQPSVAPGTVAGASAIKPKAGSTKSATLKPVKSAKADKAAAKLKKTSTTKPLVAGINNKSQSWLLFALLGLTIAYVIYEFRYDLRNYYHRLRGYSGGGRSSGPAA